MSARLIVHAGVVSLFVGSLAACGDGETSVPDAAPADVDAAGADVDAAGADADPSACHQLAQTAPMVEVIQVAEPLPAGTGGTIPDGTYHRIALAHYTGTGGASGGTGVFSQATTRQLPGTSSELIETVSGVTSRFSLEREINGTSMTVTPTCGPVSFPVTVQFSVEVGVTTRVLLMTADQRLETFELQQP
jgi:hypothetical protein